VELKFCRTSYTYFSYTYSSNIDISDMNDMNESNTNFAALFQFPYGLEPTGLYVLLCWCFIGINPKSTPPNTLIKLANT
jgi:hypothetical protein